MASCSFCNLENYKERETKTIGRPRSVCVLILKSENQSVGFTDEIQMNLVFSPSASCSINYLTVP